MKRLPRGLRTLPGMGPGLVTNDLQVGWQGRPEEPGAAARGISLGVLLGGALWVAAILVVRALL